MPHPEYLGKYTIKTLLGEGAMGVVYKAYDPGIRRLVAIKTIRHALIHDRSAQTALLERFRNEARAVGRLNHPNIVAIYELGQDGDHAYIVMEYVEGRDLAKILEANPVLPAAEVAGLMLALLDALEAAHRQGVWHRDIKPANLIVSEAGQLKVTDFGIARIESVSLTQVAMAIGTPGYMAPEQYSGERLDHRVDIFSAGVLLYRLLTGQMPFAGKPEAVMYAVMTKDPPPLAHFLPSDLAARFEPLVQRALAKDPQQRYPSAAAFAAALRACAEAGGETLPAPGGQTTLVMAASGKTPAAPVPGVPTGAASSATALTHWEESALTQVQTALARFVGPMAKIQVRQAAKKCSTLDELVALLAADITDAAQQAAFIALLAQRQGSGVTSLLTASVKAPGSATRLLQTPASGGPAEPPGATQVEQATRIMTRLIGPIARVVVKKAVARAASAAHFAELLAQELPPGAQRAQLLAELQAPASGQTPQTAGPAGASPLRRT